MRLLVLGLVLLGGVAVGGGLQVGSSVWAQGAAGGDVMMAPDPAAIARGQAVFEEVACTRCHTLNGEGRGTAAELGGMGHRLDYFARTERRSANDVVAAAFRGAPPMIMTRQLMTDEQVADVAAYMTTLRAPLVWDTTFTKEEAVQGLGVFVTAGCAACHTVAGVGATDREEAIPLRGVKEKQSQAVVEFKLETIGAGPPDAGMRDAWAKVTADSDRRAMLAFLYGLD